MATSNVDQQDTMATVNDSIIEEEETEESSMSLVEHLEELRWRIFKSLIAITVAAIVAFIFRIQIMRFLTLPLPKTADTLTKGQLVFTIKKRKMLFPLSRPVLFSSSLVLLSDSSSYNSPCSGY